MFKKKSNEKNTYGIVGLGRFGHALALELAAAGADLVVLDKEEEKVRELVPDTYVIGDAIRARRALDATKEAYAAVEKL